MKIGATIMRPELEKQLCEKYPKIFKYCYATERYSCMYRGFEHNDGWFRILDLLCEGIQSHIKYSRENRYSYLQRKRKIAEMQKNNTFQEYLENYYKYVSTEEEKEKRISNAIIDSSIILGEEPEAVKQVVAQQVKEKFGGLRFYYYGGDEFICGLVNFAERLSSITCESCGRDGKIVGTNWLRCLCKDCNKNE